MEATDKKRIEIELEGEEYLIRMFNLTNTSEQSPVFIYAGVRFWREDDQFVIQRGDKVVHLVDVMNYLEFRRVVLRMSDRPLNRWSKRRK